MTSEKRSRAARVNGARSRGPATAEGKAISSRNAMRHGLLSKIVVLCNEDKKGFEALFYMLVKRFSPVDDVEMAAIEDMAASYWRLRRGFSMEQYLLDSALPPDLPPAAQTLAVFGDHGNREKIDLLLRYQTRLQNMYNRALRSLLLMRKVPAPTVACEVPESIAAMPNEPKTPYVCPTHSRVANVAPVVVPAPEPQLDIRSFDDLPFPDLTERQFR